MKSILFLIILVTTSQLLAQDKYHSAPQETCESGEDCLVDLRFGGVNKFILVENRSGEIVGEKLTHSSNLSDTVYPKAQLCYLGEAGRICDMIQTLGGAEEGHAQVKNLTCLENDLGLVQVRFSVKYDMYPRPEIVEYLVPVCQKDRF